MGTNKAYIRIGCLIALSQMSVYSFGEEHEGYQNKSSQKTYQIYQRGETITTEVGDGWIGCGITYATSNRTLGTRKELIQASTARVSAGWSPWEGTELALHVPFSESSMRETDNNRILEERYMSGMHDPTISVFHNLFATETIITSGVLSVTAPEGSESFSQNDTRTNLGVHWSILADPAFVNIEIAWKHAWEQKVDGLEYGTGIQIAINHLLSAGVSMNGTTIFDSEISDGYDRMGYGMNIAYAASDDIDLVFSSESDVGTNIPFASLGMAIYWRF